MSDSNHQRVYLTCGTVLLIVFAFACAIAIVTVGPGATPEILAVVLLTASMAVLLLNATLLCGTRCGSRMLAAGTALLWLSFVLIFAAVTLCIVSMTGSL